LSRERVIAYADKVILKISGISVKGLNARELEESLSCRLQTGIRVIGVTGNSIDMDVYGMDEESILRDESGIIHTISLSPGITAGELAKIACAEKIVPVDMDAVPALTPGCAMERWLNAAK